MRAAVYPLAAAAAFAAASCASTPEGPAGTPQVTIREQRVTNVTTFDLANCFPREELKVPSPVNAQSLRGYLVSAQPQMTECLVDPKNRGAEKSARITVSATVTTEGARFAAESPNLTPSGAQCITQALEKRGGLDPLPKGSKPVEAKIELPFDMGVSPAVVMGVNETSDALGRFRLGLPTWCDCFEPWKAAAPAMLNGKAVVTMPTEEEKKKDETAKPRTEVTWDAAPNEAAAGVQACLAEKVKAQEWSSAEPALEVPLPVLFIHSSVDEVVAPERPEVAIQQLYALRAQNLARLEMAPARRTNASAVYDATVAKYRANPNSVSVKELRDRCKDLLDADDAWIKALQSQIEREQRAMEFLKAQAAKDAGWGAEVQTAEKQISAAETDLATAKETRAKDEAACPKVQWETR